jgi:hypothetical protein
MSNIRHSLDNIRSFRMAQSPQAPCATSTPDVPVNRETVGIPVVSPSTLNMPNVHQPHHQTHRSELESHIQQADRMIISHVESFGCTDLSLKLGILDLKTRIAMGAEMREDDRAKNSGAVKKLDEFIWEARDIVIRYIRQNECADIELKVKVLDLETRVVEYRKVFTFKSL